MLVSLLGPLEVSDGDRAVPVSGARLRHLLIRLAAEAGRPVSGSELVFAVWGDDPPADQANALQTLVSRLRRTLGSARYVQQVGNGYRLQDVSTDWQAFGDLVEQGRRAAGPDLNLAAGLFGQALALWRGPALAEVEDAEWALPLIARWQDERVAVLRARIDADVRLGRAAQVIGELEDLVRENPRQEELTQALMSALAAAGRPADALSAYERLRVRLADELGVDPSPGLREAYQHLLSLSDAGNTPARPSRRTNLRASLTSFLGRDDEVKRLSTLLEEGRLATVVGPGGAGKTRLAGVAAAQWLDRMPDGVWLVELAPVTDEANIAMVILSSLGILADQLLERSVETARKPTIDRLIDVLVDAEALLVLDNCEHVIGAVAALVDQLLGACRGLRVLATSREPLGISGEGLCLLPPLTLPDAGVGPGEAQSYPSVQLFADRAAAVSADFRITDETVRPVVEIVRRLDGLPLAIELAAARLRVLPVAEIAARLNDRFRLLTGGSRIAMPRHRTLRAVVEWSWDLLSDAERLLAERLAIFPSGATIASAHAVCADVDLPADRVLDVLIALVDKSLLKLTDDGPVRYQMLETIREFGVEQLAEREELAELRLRHARYFSALVAEEVRGLRGPEQLAHLRILEAERDNVLSALAFLCDSGYGAEALELVYPLCWYWMLLDRHAEAVRWLSLVVDASAGLDSPRRTIVEAMLEINLTAARFGAEPDEFDQSDRSSRGQELFARLGDIEPDFEPLLPLFRAILTFFSGIELDMAEALEPALASADPWVRATALMFRANLWENTGQPERMGQDARASIELFAQLGDRWGLATASTTLAQLKILEGELNEAIDLHERALQYLNEFSPGTDAVMLHLRLAELFLRTGDPERAHEQIALARAGDIQIGGRAQRMMADATVATIALLEHDDVTAHRMRQQLQADVESLPALSALNGHVLAMVLATMTNLLVHEGAVDEAGERVAQAYRFSLDTRDMPIVARVAAAVARWSVAIGRPEEAAEVIGAANAVRGAPDPTDPLTLRVAEDIAAAIGVAAYERAVARGEALDHPAALARLDPASVRPAPASSD